MSNDFQVFKSRRDLSAHANVTSFIAHCRDQLTVFGAALNFDENRWDLSAHIHLKAKTSTFRAVFSSWNASLSIECESQPMREPYLSFAKAYLRYQHALRPTKSIGNRLVALRALCAAASEKGHVEISSLDRSVFNRAAQLISNRYSSGVAFRAGGQLEQVADFLDSARLCSVRIGFKNSIKRPENERSGQRVGAEFDVIRNEMLPSPAALEALARAFHIATEAKDIIVTSAAALMCASPDRVNEVLGLRESCEVEGTHEGAAVFGLRYWPSKGADPMIKWVVPSMTDVVKKALARQRDISRAAREIARWYERNPTRLYLPPELEDYRGKAELTMQEVMTLVFEDGNPEGAPTWCKDAGVPVVKKGGKQFASFADVEVAVLAMLPRGFPELDPENGLTFAEALFISKRNQFHEKRSTYRGVIEAIPQSMIADGLGARTAHGYRSVFERMGFAEPDGSPIKIRSHQFRHYLNTLAQQGGMSELDIAKWSGRADIRHNSAYNHVSDRDLQSKLLAIKGDDQKSFGALVDQTRVSAVGRARFAELGLPTAHTTDFGYCAHDFAMSPCQLHADCMNCNEQVCVKGEHRTEVNTRAMLVETEDLLKKARDADAEGYYGASRWVEHQTMTAARLRELVDILDNPAVMPGAVIRLTHIKAASRMEQAVEARKSLGLGAPAVSQLKWTVVGQEDEATK